MEINISSEHINENSINDILIFLKTKSITAQVFKTSSIVKYINEYKVEHGLRINFFDTSKEIFKDIVWSFLKKKYKLTCAYVKYRDEYMGCILNWPSVFTKNNCNVCD